MRLPPSDTIWWKIAAFLNTAPSTYDWRILDEKPTSPDELAINAISFDDLVECVADGLDAETSQLLRAASDSGSLNSEVTKQLGEPDGT